jgi:predicted RNase H-like HicB family nuclease
MEINIVIEKDGDGYLARVDNHQNFFAFAYSEKDAIIELKNVVEMMMDYHLEQVNDERIIRNELISTVEQYAVQL